MQTQVKQKNPRTIWLADRVLQATPESGPLIDYFGTTGAKTIKKTFSFPRLRVLPVAIVFGILAISAIPAYLMFGPKSNAQEENPVYSTTVVETEPEEIIDDQGIVATPDNSIGVITIPSIGVSAPILSAGLDSQGNIMDPATNHDTVWFDGSARLGANGASFISGHVGVGTPAVFARLSQLQRGDLIKTKQVDGTVLVYTVKDVQTYSLNNLNMLKALSVHPGYSRGLNLMTCAGNYIPSARTYDARTVVYAVIE